MQTETIIPHFTNSKSNGQWRSYGSLKCALCGIYIHDVCVQREFLCITIAILFGVVKQFVEWQLHDSNIIQQISLIH